MILNESMKIRPKINDMEDFHEMIVSTLDPVKEKILKTEQEFKNNSSLKKKEEKNKEIEKKIEDFFEIFERNAKIFKEDLEIFMRKNKGNKEEIMNKLEKKVENGKILMDGLMMKKEGNNQNVLKLFELDNSTINGDPNKSISKFY